MHVERSPKGHMKSYHLAIFFTVDFKDGLVVNNPTKLISRFCLGKEEVVD